MIHLSIDLETYSDVNLKKAGLYRYVQSPAFEILLFAYSFDGAPTQVIDMAQGEKIPLEVIHALTDPQCLKHAYNAAFEWYCLSKYMGAQLPPSQWRDTMLHGLYAGYTAGLDATGRALGIPEDKQKLATGKALIRYFCVPCKPTKSNGGRTRNYPHHDPEKWELFKTYNGQDVVAEMEIERRLSVFPVPDFVQKQWETDLLINARGVAVDMDFCEGALELGETIRAQLTDEAVQLSGLQNPNSVKQLARWLSAETGDDITTLRKETIKELLGRDNADHVQRMLEIRQELGKTSTKKYDAIEAAVCDDGRVRGLLQFYGANRTGRWAGRLVQVQNLPRTYTEPLEFARELVKGRKLDALRTVYGSPNDTLSQLIRTAFVAAPGNVLIDADFSAIEARVISWLADEEWRLEVSAHTAKSMKRPPLRCSVSRWNGSRRATPNIPSDSAARSQNWPSAIRVAFPPCGRWTPASYLLTCRTRKSKTLWTSGATQTQKFATFGTASMTLRSVSSRTAVLSVFVAAPSRGSATASVVRPA